MTSLSLNPLSSSYYLSIGGAYIRLWHKQRGLLAEIPPCVVVDRQTGELKLYGQDAADIEGRVPPHLEFWRVWSADTLIDRQLLRSLLAYALGFQTQSETERWERAIGTTIILPETISPLHRKWLLHTAREAGWWYTKVSTMTQPFLVANPTNSAAIQGIFDLGFSSARLVLYMGKEVLLVASDSQLSLQNVASEFSQFLRNTQKREIIPQVFYDQHWLKTRFMFDLTKNEPTQYTPTSRDWQTVLNEYQDNVRHFLQQAIAQLSDAQQADMSRSTIWLIGGAATLLSDVPLETWPIRLKPSSDAAYASLRMMSKQR